MDAQIEQMISGYKMALDSYETTLGPDHPKLTEAHEKYQALADFAAGCNDIMALTTNELFTGMGMVIAELATAQPTQSAGQPSPSQEATPDAPPKFNMEDGPPPANVAAWGYHKAWEGLPGVAREKMKVYYDRIFAIENESRDALHFNRVLAEDGVLLRMSKEPLVKESEKILADTDPTLCPPVIHHHTLVTKIVPEVKSVAELEWETNVLVEFQNIETVWDGMFIQTLSLLPGACAVLENNGPGPDDIHIKRVLSADEFNRKFLGLDYEALHKIPRFWEFYEHQFWPKYAEEKRQLFNVHSATELKEHFFNSYVVKSREAYPPADLDVAGSDRRLLRMYDEEIDVDKVSERYFNPPRPEIKRG